MYFCFSEDSNGRIKSTSTKMVNRIETFEKSMKCLSTNEVSNDQKILSLGSSIMEVVKEMNVSLTGIIVNTYLTCLIVATATLYSSSTILFQRSFVLVLFSAANFCISLLTINRLIWITDCGYRLTLSMKKCTYHIERFKVSETCVDKDDFQLLKEEMRYYMEAPLTPLSAFSVSTSTLLGAFGTIVTYLIVLLQFKVSEEPSGETTGQEENYTSTTSTITSNLTSPFN